MVKVNIVCIGKVKESYFKEGIFEYSKRLSRFCDFTITELEEENIKNPSNSQIEDLIKKEGKKILPVLKGKVVVLAIEGKKRSSEDFASLVKSISDTTGVITFVIGGSYGLSKEVKDRADYKLSFSDMTFPHTMARLILTEQIYRAFSIIEGSAYHK